MLHHQRKKKSLFVRLFVFQINEQSVTVATVVRCGFLGYHQEEIMYWVGVFRRLGPSNDQDTPESPCTEENIHVLPTNRYHSV